MRDRITTQDALVFIMLSQQNLAGIYWMMWEPMMLSGAMAYQYLLEGIVHPKGQATLLHPRQSLGQDLTPPPTACLEAPSAMAA